MTNKQVRKVAFITGASRGIGAESAVALAKAGWDVVGAGERGVGAVLRRCLLDFVGTRRVGRAVRVGAVEPARQGRRRRHGRELGR